MIFPLILIFAINVYTTRRLRIDYKYNQNVNLPFCGYIIKNSSGGGYIKILLLKYK